LFDCDGPGLGHTCVSLPRKTHGIWHGYFPDLRPGQRYAYRVHGPYSPREGHRFNAAKLLLDPYARVIDGPAYWSPQLRGYLYPPPEEDVTPDRQNSAANVPRCVVIDPTYAWGDDRPPRTPWHRSVLYECHVKGLSMLHPEVPEALRGTYLGLACEPIIHHLRQLGVTALSLLPIHHAYTDEHLVRNGLTNYWGYNTIGYFAPDERFASRTGDQVNEFKAMVKALHRARLEVILDVVYNHTGEGDHGGPTLCFRGIDNKTYYRLREDDPRRYVDYSGCGNSLDFRNPHVVRLVMDSLRYWVTDMHVDGFRFDLATTLGRQKDGFDPSGKFFTALRQDPVLSGVKLIAEPWDLGIDGYRIGQFPPPFAEWNGPYRDTLRRFWRGDRGVLGEVASRLSGSSDLFASSGRTPQASVNFITCHDGFTLNDLVSYEHKHNEANREDNRDGTDNNLSRHWGAEGETGKQWTLAMRQRIRRNFLASLAFSQGVPMLCQGDEMGRTQHGNNNAYCLDDETSWVSWKLDAENRDFLEFARLVFRLRRDHPSMRIQHFLRGVIVGNAQLKDLTWLRADGQEMNRDDWHNDRNQALGMLIDGSAVDEANRFGKTVRGDTLLLLLNPGTRSVLFSLPKTGEPGHWVELVKTSQSLSRKTKGNVAKLTPHSLLLLRHGDGKS